MARRETISSLSTPAARRSSWPLTARATASPPATSRNYVFHGDGGSDAATLTGGKSGANDATLNANGSGDLDNSTAGFAVSVDGMAAIHANGHAGDMAQFYDSPQERHVLRLHGLPEQRPALGGYDGTGYSNSASGFGTNLGYSTAGGSDTAVFFDSAGDNTFYAYADYNGSGQQLAGMFGKNLGAGIPTRPRASAPTSAISTAGGSDTAIFFDSPGDDTYYAYADYKSGQPMAGMYGSYGRI